VIIHHTTRGTDHAQGSTVMFNDTDATVRQERGAGPVAELIIDKHKSVADGSRYPIAMETVTVTNSTVVDADTGVVVPGEPFTTLVARPRDPLTTDERAEGARAALDHNEAILVAVVEENDGPPLSPTETHRRAVANGYTEAVDTATRRLRELAAIGCIAEHTNASNRRRTYSSRQPQT
jgi:hypothetical protein